jgi:hypothetical protein
MAREVGSNKKEERRIVVGTRTKLRLVAVEI